MAGEAAAGMPTTRCRASATPPSPIGPIRWARRSPRCPCRKQQTAPRRYTLSKLPPRLIFDAESRQVNGTPQAAGVGEHAMTYTVRDADGDSATLPFTLTIDGAPSFGDATVADQTYHAGTAITPLTLPEATGGNAPLSYALSALPAGLRFDAESRRVSGMPQVAGTYAITYTVSDSDANTSAADTDTLTFTLTVTADKTWARLAWSIWPSCQNWRGP